MQLLMQVYTLDIYAITFKIGAFLRVNLQTVLHQFSCGEYVILTKLVRNQIVNFLHAHGTLRTWSKSLDHLNANADDILSYDRSSDKKMCLFRKCRSKQNYLKIQETHQAPCTSYSVITFSLLNFNVTKSFQNTLSARSRLTR